MRIRPPLAALATAVLTAISAGQSYVNFEGATTHPIQVSPDGSRLFVVNVPDNKLEVYDLADPEQPVLLRVIPVGLEPVAVAVRSNDEAWVVNTVSDSVSVVSVREGRVTDTIRAGDEPADVVFAGNPQRAFVSVAASDAVRVYDAATHAAVGSVSLFLKDPRSMVAHGSSVYVVSHRSGNGTTIVPEADAPPQPPPTNPNLPAAPQASKIVDAGDPAWAAVDPHDLPDVDLVEIDANTLGIVRQVSGVGTILYSLAVHPVTGVVYVANDEARNRVLSENALRAHAVDSRVTMVGPGVSPVVTALDLNPGFDYTTLPNLTALASALADPAAVAIDPVLDRIYVAAMGTDRLAILNGAGVITDRIEIGDTPGTMVQPRAKRGPRGLALHPSAPVMYVYNRMQNSFTLFDTQAKAKGDEFRQSHNPTPQDIHLGRKYVYDAKLSGNGTQSCVACHVDGETDGLAWDLGLTDGDLQAPPQNQPFPFNQQLNPLVDFHPMKGPMATQTLRGLGGLDPFHWRGDRPDLDSFNSGFTGILAGDALIQVAMDLTVAWMDSVAFHPNPNRNLDDTLRTSPPNANQQAGLAAFNQVVSGGLSCVGCHALPNGSNSMVINAGLLQEAQQMKVPQLRNLYRKVGFTRAAGDSKAGFGFVHDGSIDTLSAFLARPVFNAWPAATKDDIVEFLLAFSTGTAPIVGYQLDVDATNAASPSVINGISLFQSQAALGKCAVVVKGTVNGVQRGLVYDVASGHYLADRSDVAPATSTDLRDQALAGTAAWVFTGVPAQSGQRIGIDRDLDGVLDGEDALVIRGAATPGCSGAPHVYGNAEPRIGSDGFAIVVANAPPLATGTLVLHPAPDHSAGGPATRLRISASAVFSSRAVTSDAEGFAYARISIPDDPGLIGTRYVAKVVFADPCSATGEASTESLGITVQP